MQGRFTSGNQAAKRRRSRNHQLTTRQIITIADKALVEIGKAKTTDQLGSILAQLIAKASSGNISAATWLLDRLVPRDHFRLSRPLPSPTISPLEFVDDLADRVSDGELTVDQATKLSNLAKPLIADMELQSMRKQINELLAIVTKLEHSNTEIT